MTLVKESPDLEGSTVNRSNFPEFAKCAQILKNSVASEENAIEKVFPDEGPDGGEERWCGWGNACGGMECRLMILLLLYGVF